MKKFFLFVSVLLFSAINIVCTCGACIKQEEDAIPKSIIDKGSEFIISKTGVEFFNAYIKPDFSRSAKQSSGYFLSFKMTIPEKPYVDEMISFSVDSTGNVIKDMEIHGIPDCLANPEDCAFNVTEEKAVTIANEQGLEKGIKEWNKGIIWNAYYNKYVWHIMSTIEESENSNGTRSSGKEIIIDASSGKVLEKNNWSVR